MKTEQRSEAKQRDLKCVYMRARTHTQRLERDRERRVIIYFWLTYGVMDDE